MKSVDFYFHTGLKQHFFDNVKLWGSWDNSGKYSEQWTECNMNETVNSDDSYSYFASLQFNDNETNKDFEWGVSLDCPEGTNKWAIPSEVKDWQSDKHVRRFRLNSSGQKEQYYFTNLSLLGANPVKTPPGQQQNVKFALWAPNAKKVSLVIGDPAHGYIGNQGQGVQCRYLMQSIKGGIWETTIPVNNIDETVYMFEVVNDEGETKYRTDIYSRCQAGSGSFDPKGNQYNGNPIDLDGRVSCSYIMDTAKAESPIHSSTFIPVEDFWQEEFTLLKPVPKSLSDLIIYELHVGALGYGQNRAGDLDDAIALLPYLEELGVNAVELLPIEEFPGDKAWGYGTDHFCAIEFSTGGPDHLKEFVRSCHQRGIAVILDVVYNHYPIDSERAEWKYDSTSNEKNIYYWYEGKESDYSFPEGGYIDNTSSGWAPAFHDEMVRKLFISSAISMIVDYHIDGFRVDQTTSIHQYAKLHANGAEAVQAKIFGIKFLKEWARSIRMIKPNAFLIAEDHSGWDMVTKPIEEGGLGFDASWYADFYHYLIGDTNRSPNIIASAGYGGNGSLDMSFFADNMLKNTTTKKVVYNESHDECGNSVNNGLQSCRTILAAVHETSPDSLNDPFLRSFAEARCRFAAGITILSAGVPMFFMGEEAGAAKYYTFNNWYNNREDLVGLKNTTGANLFKFYHDLIKLRRGNSALRSNNIEILYTHNDNRVIAFKRKSNDSEVIVIASLSNFSYASGYSINNPEIPDAQWKEIFNSDSVDYGGDNVGNLGAVKSSNQGWLNAVLPANGFIVLERV